MAEQLAELPKATLLQKLQGQIAANKRAKSHAESVGEKVLDAIGPVTAAAAGAAIGYAEIRYADPKKGPLSLGPVDLSLAVATAATGLAFMGFNPGKQMTYIAAGSAGAYGASRGRVMALAALEAKKKKEAESGTKTGYDVGADELSDAERAFLG